MPPASNLDPDALLCERCGYSIANLRETEPCPECGQPAGQSWPKNRPGSLYQLYKRAPGRWLWGNFQVIRSPNRLFRRIRIDPQTSSRLLHANLLLTAALLTGGWMWVREPWLAITPIIWLGTYTVILLLTYIETLGLRVFSRSESRKWRITPDVAWSVCHHASVGWFLGGLLMLLVFTVDPVGHLTSWEWGNARSRALLGASFNDVFFSLRVSQMVLPLLFGMLAFETLVYLGIRQCRYANTPASVTQQGPAAPST